MSTQSEDTAGICDQISEEVRVFFNSQEFKDLIKSAVANSVTKELQTLRDQLEQTDGKVMDLENDLKAKGTIITSLQKEQKSNTE